MTTTIEPFEGLCELPSGLRAPLDPIPWAYALAGGLDDPAREAIQVTGGFVFYPRPGFEQNREIYP